MGIKGSVVAGQLRALLSSSGVSGHPSVGSSPSRDTCVLQPLKAEMFPVDDFA